MIVTRFAPSPTGSLHVGSARTAIFNWAFARKHQGKFLLRIDDTDQARNLPNYSRILEYELQWLGLKWDNILYQSKRQNLYAQAVDYLLDENFAYIEQVGPNQSIVYFDVDRISSGVRCINDEILGEVKFDTDDIQDFIIQRSDGSPLYNLATVVDDMDTSVSHVIRGQEHLTNTFAQLLIYEAFSTIPPKFAHIPFICAPGSNKKLSKRDIQLGTIEELRKDGYLPEAVVNYLSHLGWSLDGITEIWKPSTIVENFDLKNVSAGAAQFDPHKLMWVQSQHIRGRSETSKLIMVQDWLQTNSRSNANERLYPAQITTVLELMEERFRIAKDIEPYRHFLHWETYNISERAYTEFLDKVHVREMLEQYLKRFTEIHPMCFLYANTQSLRNKAKQFYELAVEVAKEFHQKPATLIHALRAATTGQTVGFGVFEGIVLLGKARATDRIKFALAKIDAKAVV